MRIRNAEDNPSVFPSHEAKRQAILKYSVFVLNGTASKEICELLQQEFGFNESQSIVFVKDIRNVIAETTAENNEKIVEIHTLLYEDIYRRFDKLNVAKGKMITMAQKEKLLNLYQEDSTEVVVNTQNNFNIQTHYDVSKLSPDQSTRLDQLLLKASQKE